MVISLDPEIARDLIETKLRVLTEKIHAILNKWELDSIDELIEGTKTGKFPEAEDDAIDLQNLRDKRSQIEKLLAGLQWLPVSYEQLIFEAYDIINPELRGFFSKIDLDEDTGRLKVKLKSGIILFIRYNNYNQYSYVILFSSQKLDRLRFDNFDDRWEVSSKPNHTHPRYKEKAKSRPFSGIPSKDIMILCNLLKSGDIYSFESE